MHWWSVRLLIQIMISIMRLTTFVSNSVCVPQKSACTRSPWPYTEHRFNLWSQCGGVKDVSKVPSSKVWEWENVWGVLVFLARRRTTSWIGLGRTTWWTKGEGAVLKSLPVSSWSGSICCAWKRKEVNKSRWTKSRQPGWCMDLRLNLQARFSPTVKQLLHNLVRSSKLLPSLITNLMSNVLSSRYVVAHLKPIRHILRA